MTLFHGCCSHENIALRSLTARGGTHDLHTISRPHLYRWLPPKAEYGRDAQVGPFLGEERCPWGVTLRSTLYLWGSLNLAFQTTPSTHTHQARSPWLLPPWHLLLRGPRVTQTQIVLVCFGPCRVYSSFQSFQLSDNVILKSITSVRLKKKKVNSIWGMN